jgi:hypothetical protein
MPPAEFDEGDLRIFAEGAMVTMREHIHALWLEMCEAAPAAIIDGKKGLFLDEAALVKFGAELED